MAVVLWMKDVDKEIFCLTGLLWIKDVDKEIFCSLSLL
jgi:hypothetical protein